MAAFRQDLLQAHGGEAAQIEHIYMDMSAAHLKGVTQSLPEAAISYDRYHVAAMASQAMHALQRSGLKSALAWQLKEVLQQAKRAARGFRTTERTSLPLPT